MSRLEPCSRCGRHVRVEESACPFCEEPLALEGRPARPLPSRRLGRAATLAFGAGVVGATTLVACEDDRDLAAVPIYGAPAAGTSNGAEPGGGGSAGEGGGGSAEGGQSGAPPADSGGAGEVSFAVYGGPPGEGGSR